MLAPILLGAGGTFPDWARSVVQWSDLVSGVLGVFIAYQAYRGYRRNRSRPMLFLSVGFVLALGVPTALLVVSGLLPTTSVVVLGLVSQASEIAGLACIVYALWT